MSKQAPKIVAFNWKMNPTTLKAAGKLFDQTRDLAAKTKSVQVIIAPPTMFLWPLRNTYRGRVVSFAAQNVFYQDSGSFTGAVSPAMIADSKVSMSLVGHSERRNIFGVSDEVINAKVKALIDHNMQAILCVGEHERDEQAHYVDELTEQIRSALAGVPAGKLDQVILAYEPVWAIGAGAKRAVTPEELFSSIILVRKIVSSLYNQKAAQAITVLYGGSVNADNIAQLAAIPGVDGFLVGRASLDKTQVAAILKACHNA